MHKTDKPSKGGEIASKFNKKRKRYFIVQGPAEKSESLRRAIEGIGHAYTISHTFASRKLGKSKVLKKHRNLLASGEYRSLEGSRYPQRKVFQPSLPGSGVIVVSADYRTEDLPPSPANLDQLAREVLGDPSVWFSTPNPNLGNRKPADLVGTKDEHKVYDLLCAVDQGLF